MGESRFNSGAHVVYDLHVHLVLTPKYRRKVMTERVGIELGSAFREVCGNLGCELVAYETDGDHAHLLVT